jgi:hypothetical protein
MVVPRCEITILYLIPNTAKSLLLNLLFYSQCEPIFVVTFQTNFFESPLHSFTPPLQLKC